MDIKAFEHSLLSCEIDVKLHPDVCVLEFWAHHYAVRFLGIVGRILENNADPEHFCVKEWTGLK